MLSSIKNFLPLLLIGLFAVTGCSSSYSTMQPDAAARSAIDTPDHFLAGSHDSDATEEPAPGEGCHNPMVDPRDGTRLILSRSTNNRGDYEVPDGRYSVGDRELLRLDCDTGRVIGIVKR